MRLIVALIFLSPASCATTPQDKVDWVRLVDCIAEVERGVPWQPGGVLCWTRAAWEEETNLPYEYAIEYTTSRVLAISRLARQARSNHRVTINEIASLWNRGPNGPRTTAYGERVSNLYHNR